jgi:phosphoserine phosphatase
MQDIAEHLPITEGVDRTDGGAQRCGYKIAILSGGFTYFGEYLQRKYGIDYVYANELEIDDNGKLPDATWVRWWTAAARPSC